MNWEREVGSCAVVSHSPIGVGVVDATLLDGYPARRGELCQMLSGMPVDG